MSDETVDATQTQETETTPEQAPAVLLPSLYPVSIEVVNTNPACRVIPMNGGTEVRFRIEFLKTTGRTFCIEFEDATCFDLNAFRLITDPANYTSQVNGRFILVTLTNTPASLFALTFTVRQVSPQPFRTRGILVKVYHTLNPALYSSVRVVLAAPNHWLYGEEKILTGRPIPSSLTLPDPVALIHSTSPNKTRMAIGSKEVNDQIAVGTESSLVSNYGTTILTQRVINRNLANTTGAERIPTVPLVSQTRMTGIEWNKDGAGNRELEIFARILLSFIPPPDES